MIYHINLTKADLRRILHWVTHLAEFNAAATEEFMTDADWDLGNRVSTHLDNVTIAEKAVKSAASRSRSTRKVR